YNRQYFVLGTQQGMQGPYVMVADFFLAALLALWFYESAILKRPSSPVGGSLWPSYLPFAAVCLLSAFAARKIDWTSFEMIRVVKVGLVLWYTRHHLRPRLWWLCVAAMGAALTVQSTLGILEVSSGRSGVMWLLGGGTGESIAPEFLQSQNFYG